MEFNYGLFGCVLNNTQTEMRILPFSQGNENLLIWLLTIIWLVLDKCLGTSTIEFNYQNTPAKNKMTLWNILFVWNHSHIHKYLITTFNKEYITLQGIQTSTFFFFEKQNFTASRHPPLSQGAIAQRAWTEDAGVWRRRRAVGGAVLTALPAVLIGSSPQLECTLLIW